MTGFALNEEDSPIHTSVITMYGLRDMRSPNRAGGNE